MTYTVESRPGQHHHVADLMSPSATIGADDRAIPDEILSLLTLANFVIGWIHPSCNTGKRCPPLTAQRIIEGQSHDPW